MAQDRDQWPALVNTVIIIWVTQKAGNVLTGSATVISSKAQLKGVSEYESHENVGVIFLQPFSST